MGPRTAKNTETIPASPEGEFGSSQSCREKEEGRALVVGMLQGGVKGGKMQKTLHGKLHHETRKMHLPCKRKGGDGNWTGGSGGKKKRSEKKVTVKLMGVLKKKSKNKL